MDRQVLNTLAAVAREKDEVKRRVLMAKSNAALGAHFIRHTPDLEELAFDLLNRAWRDSMTDDIVPRIIDVKTVGLGDQDKVEDDLRGMRAYWQGKGGMIFSDLLRYEEFYMPRKEMVAAIDLHRDEIATDFWGQFARLQEHCREKLGQLPVTELIELVKAAINDDAGIYGEFARSTITDDQVDSVVDEVSAKSKGGITILGQRQATRVLSNIGMQFSDALATQVFRTGQIGIYKGYPVVEVENFENFEGYDVLDSDELLVVGRDAGRLTYYGETPKVQQLPKEAFYIRWETARDAGMSLYGADKGRIGRIVLT